MAQEEHPNTTESSIRVLIVDDHPMVREGLCSMLSTAPDIAVISEASNASEALTQAQTLQPDVILLDIQLPDGDGLTLLPQLKAVAPHSEVLMVTMHENASYVTRAMAGGASGYVLKGARRSELLTAIRTVAAAESTATPFLLGKAQRQSSSAEAPVASPPAGNEETLSPVEQELLRLLAEGLSNKQVCTRLNWSLGTVKKYVQRLFEKLQVTDRTQAVVEAIRRGMIDY